MKLKYFIIKVYSRIKVKVLTKTKHLNAILWSFYIERKSWLWLFAMCAFFIPTLYAANLSVFLFDDNLQYLSSDAPRAWQTFFQDPATPSMEGILYFNNHLSFLLVVIVVFVGWFLFFAVYYFIEYNNSTSSKFVHSKELEILWTSVPALILLILSVPSFTLLYSMDELSSPGVTLKVFGHQWFWSYEISDFSKRILTAYIPKGFIIKYSSYMVVLDEIFSSVKKGKGGYRLLETDKRVLLPTKTHIRLLVSAADVLHSWTVPSFGLKIDACPGRLNQANLFIKRSGLFFGQCSEICGVNHGFMPIAVLAVPVSTFSKYVDFRLIEFLKKHVDSETHFLMILDIQKLNPSRMPLEYFFVTEEAFIKPNPSYKSFKASESFVEPTKLPLEKEVRVAEELPENINSETISHTVEPSNKETSKSVVIRTYRSTKNCYGEECVITPKRPVNIDAKRNVNSEVLNSEATVELPNEEVSPRVRPRLRRYRSLKKCVGDDSDSARCRT